jgi:hypothetical protein
MDEASIARYVCENQIDLVGIGAMTRMIAKAYRVADTVRAVGVLVGMGGSSVLTTNRIPAAMDRFASDGTELPVRSRAPAG